MDKDFLLTGLTVASFPPNFPWAEVDRLILGSEIGQKRADIPEVNLKHRPSPKWRLHGACLESAMTLAEQVEATTVNMTKPLI